MNLLWVTSCANDMWKASGANLVKSFIDTKTEGNLLICYEGKEDFKLALSNGKIFIECLDDDAFLKDWLEKFKDSIPVHLGGTVEEPLCKCKDGPHEPHYKSHIMPCLGHWFNKNHSRWFRKIASLKIALEKYKKNNDTAIIWLDADCTFKQPVTARIVRGWFKHTNGVFYCKHTRPVLDSGVVGYSMASGGDKVIRALIDVYTSGDYQGYKRWDDSYTLQKVVFGRCSAVNSVDLAYGVGPHADVVEHSALGLFLQHFKGRHGRELGIMT